MTINKPIRGWQGEVRVALSEEGLLNAKPLHLQESPLNIATSTDSKFIIGQRSPYAILEGSTEITGSFTAPFEDDFFARLAGVRESGPVEIPETPFVVGIFLNGFKDEEDAIIVYGVRFGTWTSSIGQDDIVDQTLDWTGERVEFKQCKEIGKKPTLYKRIVEGEGLNV